MHNPVSILIVLACVCCGQEVQTLDVQPQSAPCAKSQTASKQVEAVATLLLSRSPAATFHPSSPGISHPFSTALNKRGDIKNIEEFPEAGRGIGGDLGDRLLYDSYATELKKILDKNVYIVGAGTGKTEVAEYMAKRFLRKPPRDVTKIMRIAYPNLYTEFKAETKDKSTGMVEMQELLDSEPVDTMEVVGTEVLQRLQRFNENIVIGWDATGSDADYEAMKDGVVIHVDTGAEKEDMTLPADSAEETEERWRKGYGRAALTVNIKPDEYERKEMLPEYGGKKLLTSVLEFLEPGIMEFLDFEKSVPELKVSQLRKLSLKYEIDEDDIDDACDSKDPKSALVKMIKTKMVSPRR